MKWWCTLVPLSFARMPVEYDSRVCDACGKLVADEREALLDEVRQRTGWPAIPFSECTTVRFAFLDTEGLVEAVRLRHGLAGHRKPPSFVSEGDGLFTLEFPAGDAVRVEYQLELLGPGGAIRLIHDPLNPLLTDDPFGGKSVVQRDGSSDSIWLSPPRPEFVGDFIEQPIELAGPGEIHGKRKMAIWQPPGFEPADALPLVLFLDGADYVRYAHMRRMLENMVGEDVLAPCRAVFIAPPQRNQEYSANSNMPAWLERLLQHVGELVAVPGDRAQRIAVGTSLGALCLLHNQSINPQLFSSLVLQSGSYFQPDTDQVEAQFPWFGRINAAVSRILELGIHANELSTSIAATCGTVGENIRNNDRMMEALRTHGVDILSYQRVRDAHNWTAWRNCIGEALMALLPGPRRFPSL